MKKCPYCAEEIQDEAIKCRWCGSMLADVPGTSPPGGAQPGQPAESATAGPAQPPSSWATPEPAVQQPQVAPPSGQPWAQGPPPVAAAADEALQYTHSGQRYLLGYGATFFGIWDRQAPGGPVVRFPRTDQGWAACWQQFSTWEPNSAEVGIGGGTTSTAATSMQAPYATGAQAAQAWGGHQTHPTRPVNGAWWLMPILLGFIGGLIAWLVNKDADPKTARMMLIVGIAISAVFLLLYLAGSGSPGSTVP